jgi:hypothetical protein
MGAIRKVWAAGHAGAGFAAAASEVPGMRAWRERRARAGQEVALHRPPMTQSVVDVKLHPCRQTQRTTITGHPVASDDRGPPPCHDHASRKWRSLGAGPGIGEALAAVLQ